MMYPCLEEKKKKNIIRSFRKKKNLTNHNLFKFSCNSKLLNGYKIVQFKLLKNFYFFRNSRDVFKNLKNNSKLVLQFYHVVSLCCYCFKEIIQTFNTNFFPVIY